jgi:uncharacterized protein
MTISMYGMSVPVFERVLGNMLVWLDKAQAHAEARRFDPNNYLGLRLAPDMLPFASQIRIACDQAKGCTRRLAGVDAPVHPDDEATLDQLRDRIRSTLAFIASVPAEKFEGSEARMVEVPLRNRDPLRFDGESYLRHYALPNVYFHVTMTYALLRHAGVELGKSDFLGGR